MATATIERSAGDFARIGAVSFLYGGGYEGLTNELDSTVERAAILLRESYGMDVQIRFNSDRRSGGAFLKTHGDSRHAKANCEVGINAGLCVVRETPGDFDSAVVGERIVVHSYISATSLLNPAVANSGAADGRYSYVEHETIEDALAFIRENVLLRDKYEIAPKVRAWVKIKGSDKRAIFPVIGHKQVFEADGYHYHYEEVVSDKPKRITVQAAILEDNGDGTYTEWQGRFGTSGRLKEGDEVVSLSTKADFRRAAELDRILNRAQGFDC